MSLRAPRSIASTWPLCAGINLIQSNNEDNGDNGDNGDNDDNDNMTMKTMSMMMTTIDQPEMM